MPVRLDLNPAPRWRDFDPGVRLFMAPVNTSLMQEVWRHPDIEAAREAQAEDGAPGNVPLLEIAKVIAILAVTEWEGVSDEKGKDVPVTPEGLRALLEVPAFARDFQAQIVFPALGLVEEGKRLRALAEWHFGQGADYCRLCPARCADCPERAQEQLGPDAASVWRLALASEGQVRVLALSTMERSRVIRTGYDMTAVLALGAAMGVSAGAVAAFMPIIEQEMTRGFNGREDG